MVSGLGPVRPIRSASVDVGKRVGCSFGISAGVPPVDGDVLVVDCGTSSGLCLCEFYYYF